MKCIAAVVMVALAVAVESATVPLVYSGATTYIQQNVVPKYVSGPVTYSAPAVTAYSVPTTTYVEQKYAAAPAVSYSATYSAPQTTIVQEQISPKYVAPVVSAPVVTSYSVPEKTVVQQNVAPKYVAQAVTYSAPAPVSYVAPAPVSYVAPYSAPATVAYSAPVARIAAPVAYSAPAVYASDSDIVEAAPVSVAPVETVVSQPAVAVVAPKEARYVAANPGAVHEAPLAGHTVNQQSLNVEPAPGTQ